MKDFFDEPFLEPAPPPHTSCCREGFQLVHRMGKSGILITRSGSVLTTGASSNAHRLKIMGRGGNIYLVLSTME
jgi:hypothetical protein